MTNHPNLAFIGKAGSGKDTAAELLIETLGYRRVAFADKLKDVAVQLWGTEARTDRDKLQQLGVAVRVIEPDTWVNYALDQLRMESGVLRVCGPVPVASGGGPFARDVHPVVVTDCRFKNEAWALKGAGFTIVRIVADRNERINRLRTNGKLGPAGWEEHVSETELDDWPEDYRVQNVGTKPDLLDELARVIALDTGSTAP